MASDDSLSCINKNGIRKSKGLDAINKFLDLFLAVRPGISGIGMEGLNKLMIDVYVTQTLFHNNFLSPACG